MSDYFCNLWENNTADCKIRRSNCWGWRWSSKGMWASLKLSWEMLRVVVWRITVLNFLFWSPTVSYQICQPTVCGFFCSHHSIAVWFNSERKCKYALRPAGLVNSCADRKSALFTSSGTGWLTFLQMPSHESCHFGEATDGCHSGLAPRWPNRKLHVGFWSETQSTQFCVKSDTNGSRWSHTKTAVQDHNKQ